MEQPTGEWTHTDYTNVFEGATSGGSDTDAGEWRGTFYGPTSQPTGVEDDLGTNDINESIMAVKPSGVAGEFLGHFSNGHAIGAFGATPPDMPADDMPGNGN